MNVSSYWLLPLSLLFAFQVHSQETGEATADPVPGAEVARAQFTTGMKNREPIDQIVVLTAPSNEAYFFTDIRNMDGRVAVHNWEYEGKVVSIVPFQVGGPRWRVFSKVVLEPDQAGEWSVMVTDQETGWPLHSEFFRYEVPAEFSQPAVPDEEPLLPSE